MSTQTLNGHADKVASKIDDQCFTGTGSRYVTPVSVMCRLRDSVQSLERENVSLRHTITLLEKVVVGMEVEMVCSCNAEELRQAREENARLRVAIERALADSESGDGWGPDITVCGYLREALSPR